MIRAAMSIKAGKITPSTILNKLGTYSQVPSAAARLPSPQCFGRAKWL
jgi:TnpA family transposase